MLKINDVEGYLRMVQVGLHWNSDFFHWCLPHYLFLYYMWFPNLFHNNVFSLLKDAKSDRVKQLLKETEKYLQKLGAKLKEAKDMSRSYESNMDENRATSTVDEVALENDDDNDQAKVTLENHLISLYYTNGFTGSDHHLMLSEFL